MSTITIYHNPACGTSRNVLGLIRNSGEEPTVIEYLKTPPDRDTLKTLIAATGMPVRTLREKGTPYAELDLGNPKWNDDDLIGFMPSIPSSSTGPSWSRRWACACAGPRKPCSICYRNRSVARSTRKTVRRWSIRMAAVSESRLDLPNIDAALFQQPDTEHLFAGTRRARAALPAALWFAARTLVQPPRSRRSRAHPAGAGR